MKNATGRRAVPEVADGEADQHVDTSGTGRGDRGDRTEKSRILNEFVAVSGYHRKHAIRLLRERPVTPAMVRRIGPRVYGTEIRDALIVLWETSDRVCSKRLQTTHP